MNEKINVLRLIAVAIFTLLFCLDSNEVTAVIRICMSILVIVLSLINMTIMISNKKKWWPEMVMALVYIMLLAWCILLFVYGFKEGVFCIIKRFIT